MAVIFEDGTTMGYSKPYAAMCISVTGVLSQTCSVSLRLCEAEAWNRWRSFLKSLDKKDAKTAVAESIKAANSTPVVHDDAWVREEMLTKYVGWRAQVGAKFAERETAQ